MYTLYRRTGTASYAVEVLLEELGVEFERVNVVNETGHQSLAGLKQLNPLGEVPTLIAPGGTVMTESAAIMIYLADAHPGAGMAPAASDPARAAYLRWMVYLATNVYMSYRHMYQTYGYVPEASLYPPIQEMARNTIIEEFQQIEDALSPGPFVLGDRFSAVDIYLAMFPDWHTEPEQLLSRFPALNRLCTTVNARPSIARVRANG